MNPQEYRATLARLGLTQDQAARFLGVSLRTANRYANKGPEGPAAVALTMLQAMPDEDRAAQLCTFRRKASQTAREGIGSGYE